MTCKSNPFRLLDGLLAEAKFQADACESYDSLIAVERRKNERLKARIERFLRLRQLESEAREAAARSRLEIVNVERVLELTRRCLCKIDRWFPAYGADGHLTDNSESRLAESQELYRPAIEELSRIADWLEGSELAMPSESGIKKPHECPIKIEGKDVYVEGICVPLDMTSDRREDAILFLQYLIDHKGDWISGPEIDEKEKKKQGQGRPGVRWDRIKASLPDAIKMHIKTSRKKGHCIQWRN